MGAFFGAERQVLFAPADNRVVSSLYYYAAQDKQTQSEVILRGEIF